MLVGMLVLGYLIIRLDRQIKMSNHSDQDDIVSVEDDNSNMIEDTGVTVHSNDQDGAKNDTSNMIQETDFYDIIYCDDHAKN